MLSSSEVWRSGFVTDAVTRCLVTTFNATGAVMTAGFLRDPDGRLVLVRG
jgi:hypothetical protein